MLVFVYCPQVRCQPVLYALNHLHQGFVYLKFDSVDSARKAISALDGRWFAGKQIDASFIPEATFDKSAKR